MFPPSIKLSLISLCLVAGALAEPAPAARFELQAEITYPGWLPAGCYTSAEMELITFKKVAPLIKLPWTPGRQAVMYLEEVITSRWPGHLPEGKFWVLVEQFGPAGNFRFECVEPGGPRGYMERTGKYGWLGFPRFRYWLQPYSSQEAPGEQSGEMRPNNPQGSEAERTTEAVRRASLKDKEHECGMPDRAPADESPGLRPMRSK